MGNPLRNGHRVLGDGGARHLSSESSGHSVPAAAGDRRRRARVDHPGGVLPVWHPVVHGTRRVDDGSHRVGRVAATPRHPSFWPYVLGPGALSWAALYLGGFHPALALVPIVPFMPHSPRDLGLFDPREELLPDTLNRFEHWWATPVQFVLLFFGFANAGVPFEQIGAGTYYVVAALLLGKPLGILTFSGAARLAGARLPSALRVTDLLVVGVAASIGFTVSLFFATAAFPEGSLLAETKMGALLSFAAAPLALLVARVLRVGAVRVD